MKKAMGTMVLAIGLAGRAWAQSQSYVILMDDRRIDATSVLARPDGTIVVTTPSGQTLEFERTRVKQAMTPRPPELDQAGAAFQARRFDEAVRLLREVYAKNRYFHWGEQASRLIGRAYAEKGDAAEAIKAFEEHLQRFPRAEQDMEWMWLYMNTLLQAGQSAKLEPRLNRIIAEGARGDAARALILRGDLRLAGNQLEAAVLDYLRTVMFHASEKEQLPTAMFKAAATLERLRDPRAKEWYRRVAEEFPNSPEAAEARKKI